MTLNGVKQTMMCLVVLTLAMHVTATQGWASSSLAVKKALFQKAELAMQEADTNKTRFFAPKTFGQAMDLYKSAENDYAHERSMKDINDKMDQAVLMFNSAVKISDDAAKILQDADIARNNAHKVMASRYKPNEWDEAENTFKRAIAKFEKGDKEDAQVLSREAEALYKIVERHTIVYSYMAEIWDTLKKIETMKDKDLLAPKTYNKALELARQAQSELERQAYGNETAKALIKEALDQAKYGLKLSECIKALKDEGKTWEDLFLDAKIPLESMDSIIHKS